MKNIIVFTAIAAFALTACQGQLDPFETPDERPIEKSSSIVFSASTEGAGTKTTLSENEGMYDVLWCENDQIIIVDGAPTPNVGVYTTSSTTTQAEFSFLSGEEAAVPDYKAYYPASIYNSGSPVLPDVQDYATDNISKSPMYAESSTNNLAFKNLCGIVRLNISTSLVGQKVSRITVAADQGISGTFSISSCSAVVAGTDGVVLNCGEDGVAINSTPTPFHIAVPEGTYTNMKIVVETTNGVKQTRSSKVDIKVERSKITDITLPFNNLHVDLSSSGTANCYNVKGAGSYKFNATKKGNGSETLAGINKDTDAAGISSAELVWASFGTSSTPEATSLIKDIHYENGYVCFSTPETFNPGNAVIAIKDGSDNILWSWHIWLYNYDGTVLTGANGKEMMNCNLGAVTSGTNCQSYGMYYQWGRKDPFVGPSSSTSTTLAAVCGRSKTIEVGAVTVEAAVQNPTEYYVMNNTANRWENGGHWCSEDAKTTLWSDSGKTIFDPCPPGWRTPSLSELTGMGTANTFYSGTNGFPKSGYVNTNGAFVTATNGTLWSTTVDGVCGKIQVVYSNTATYKRSADMGFNIRCIKE